MFLRPVLLTPVNESAGRTVWEVESDAIYQSSERPLMIIVPRGFQTDLASVPRLPVLWLLAGGSANSAAVVHDYLYRSKMVSRAIADDIFFEIMEATGVPLWRCWLMFGAVRVFGGNAYGR